MIYMAKYCGLLVYYNNGEEELFYGGLHADEKLLRIWPAKETHTINIPLVSIKKYMVTGGTNEDPRNQMPE